MLQKPGEKIFFVWGEFLIGGNGFENVGLCSREDGKISKRRKMADFGSKGVIFGVLGASG